MGLLWLLGTGLVAGSVHVFTGPDHLAAVAPLAIDERRGTWRTGFLWGVGHSSGVWVLAALALLFRESLPVDSISEWSERLVGFVLVAIGLWGWRRATRRSIHTHVHEHDGLRHAHTHVHDTPDAHDPTFDHTAGHRHTHRALGIGTLHGLAGTSHLLGVLPALLLPTRGDAMAYVAGFGLGSIVAMTVFSTAVGWMAGRLERITAGMYRRFMLGSCAMVLAVGAFWIVKGFWPAT